MTKRPKLHLIDGSGYIFRAYHAIRYPLTAPDGTPTHAVVGFAKMINKLLRVENPSHISIAFDTNQPNFRHTIYDQYKANRQEPPADLTPQFPLVHELVRLLGLYAVSKVGFEADDLLATQARLGQEAGYDVVLVTGDKDLMQLVGPHLTLFDPMKDKFFAREDVIEKFGVAPEHIADLLALAGDASDNVPGVPRVGDVSAAKLVAAFGDVERIIAGVTHKESLGEKKGLKLYERQVLEHQASARLSKRLVILDDHVAMPFAIDDLRFDGPNEAELAAFFVRLNANSLLREFSLPAPEKGVEGEPLVRAAPAFDHDHFGRLSAAGHETGKAGGAGTEGKTSEVGRAHKQGPGAGDGPSGNAAGSAGEGHDGRPSAGHQGADAASARRTSMASHAASERLPLAVVNRCYTGARAGSTTKERPGAGPLFGEQAPTRPIDRATYRTLYADEELVALGRAIEKKGLVSFDTETTSLNALEAELIGISCALVDEVPVYIPMGHHYLGAPSQLSVERVLAVLGPLLEREDIAKVGQHLKYDALVLGRYNISLAGIAHDSMLAAYVLDPSRLSYGLDALALDHLGHETISFDAICGRGKNKRDFYAVPIDEATAYAAEDADVALRLCQKLVARIYDEGREALYRDLEMPLVPVLIAMEQAGIAIDTKHLAELDKEFGQRLAAIEQEAAERIGRTINLNSPKQLAHLFFEELKLTPGRKTKSGFSTDQSTLESLAHEHPLPATILRHRLLSKLLGTYVEALPRMASPTDQRVHTSFQQTGTATGRLSSTDPNLQNIPSRGEDGRRIRQGLVARAGCVLMSADYSQIELRILAHLANDPHFVAAFKQGEDIHARTAQEILTGGQPASKEMRRRAKAINFGILYGQTDFGLSRALQIPRHEAEAYIKQYFARYARIRGYFDRTIEAGRETGYVETLFGRRRPLPNLLHKNGSLRQAAERIAMNAPIQGSAADLIKVAMLAVHRELNRGQAKSRLLLQVHDELVLEVAHDEQRDMETLVRREMIAAAALRVPLLVDVGAARSWAEAH